MPHHTGKILLSDVPINDLIPYERNPRKNDPAVEPVARSLEEFGYVKIAIVVDESMELLCGHTTLKAMRFLGWETAPEVTQVYGLTPEQKKAYRIADNKTGTVAEWEITLLLAEIEDLRNGDYSTLHTGFTDAEIKALIKENEPGDLPDFGKLDDQLKGMDGLEDVTIEIIVPKKYEKEVIHYLSNGEGTTKPQLGRGVLIRAGLL